ncbi:NAD(P)/FAD-dependent oxidoreductase [Rhodococcus sp. X156]|uniref:phytoene desaturase family protein n=1 Tax=Rhodococcus sp. X156 TaxID=2499145 RepID=UPI000FD9F9C7|nr:NAD(P)/FAD-dependent oxidoreductase [Rhodococcus sp. X156]
MHDVIVVGSGHNALVSACYLARSGLDVTVLEADTVLGGAVSTVERFPGHQVDRGSSAHLMVRHLGIIEELDLAAHGLSYADCDPWAFAPAPAGSDAPALVFHRDLDTTCASIEAACGASEADAYRRFVAEWGPRSVRVLAAFAGPPTPGHLLRSFWGMDSQGNPARLSREFLTSGDALLEEWFDDERLRAALAWFGAQSGPPTSEVGTAPMVGFAAAMHSIPPGRAIGGSGALTKALASRLRSDGGEICLGDAVTSLRRGIDGWQVRTASGRRLQARTVVAGCHVLTTLDLLAAGGERTAEQARWRRGVRVGPGIGMVVRLATSGLPQYSSASPHDSPHAGLQLLVSDRRQLHAAHGAALAGELPPRPVVLAMSFSTLDRSTVPEGEQQLSLWAQWHPYRLSGGRSWDDVGQAEADRIIAEVDALAPGFAATELHRHVQTPLDLERELRLIGGNVMHVEMSMDQMMLWRPAPELAGYRVPGLDGLYLTGASTHPGGGVAGASGRNTAALVLKDARGGLLRRTVTATQQRLGQR